MGALHLPQHSITYYSKEYIQLAPRFLSFTVKIAILLTISFLTSAQTAPIHDGMNPSEAVDFDKVTWNLRVSFMEEEARKSDAWLLENEFSSNPHAKSNRD